MTAGRSSSGVSGAESSASLSLTAVYDLPAQGSHGQSAQQKAAAINRALKEERNGEQITHTE